MATYNALRRKIHKSLITRGVLGTVRFVIGSANKAIRQARRGAEQTSGAILESPFDFELGTDTAGVVPLSELAIPNETWVHGAHYQAINPSVDFAVILSDARVRIEEFSFVDLGSGKGRAILMAAQLPFRRVIGVEFSRQLHEIAEENLRRVPNDRIRTGDVQLLLADATDYEFPKDSLVIYMYNPFSGPVMQKVVDNAIETIVTHPRRLLVLYFTPKLLGLWQATGLFKVRSTGPGYVLLDTDGPGQSS